MDHYSIAPEHDFCICTCHTRLRNPLFSVCSLSFTHLHSPDHYDKLTPLCVPMSNIQGSYACYHTILCYIIDGTVFHVRVILLSTHLHSYGCQKKSLYIYCHILQVKALSGIAKSILLRGYQTSFAGTH